MTTERNRDLDPDAIASRLASMRLDPSWVLFGQGEQPRDCGAFLNTHEHALLTLFRASKDDVKRGILAGLLGASPALVDLPLAEFEAAVRLHLQAVWPGEATAELGH